MSFGDWTGHVLPVRASSPEGGPSGDKPHGDQGGGAEARHPSPSPTLAVQEEGGPPMSDRERAIAIRSLVVATSSQTAAEALAKAAADVKLNRAARQMMVTQPR